MVPRAGLEPARIAPHAPQTCAATNYATSADCQTDYLLAGGLFGCTGISTLFAGAAFAGTAELSFASAGIVIVCTPPESIFASVTGFTSGAGVASVAASSSPADKTETLPLNAGIEIINADSIKTIAATMVNFARTEAVPRGVNAVLETLLVNKAPASVFPGWSNTEPIRTTHEMKNIA